MSSLVHIDDVSVVIAVLGGFIISFGLVSFFVKERLYLSEALVSVIVGIILGPEVLKVLDPLKWGTRDGVSHDFTRLVISIQIMFSGVALPRAYLVKEWKSLFVLLVPVMLYMWVVGGLIVWWIIPNLKFLEALSIAACITPTDPILANSVVKGRFAEKHVPPHVRNLLSAESATNDGLTYPFLYLALYLMQTSVGTAIGEWILYAWVYQILLSCVIGWVVGYIARKLLYLAERNRLIDKESFLVFAIALSLFLTGFVTIIGSNEFVACFVAGTSFTWDDWFRKETEEAHLQEVIDMLLNLAIFVYVGAVVPWKEFQEISFWRLITCAILVLIFRRVPAVLGLLKFIPAMKTYREAAFIGWFGPIGIGAIYYVTVIREQPFVVNEHDVLFKAVEPVVYFMILSSILVHGITIPLVKISKRINTRTLTSGTISNINNQVSRLPLVRIGTDLILRKEKTSIQPDEPADTSSTTITIDAHPEVQVAEAITTTSLPPKHDEKQTEQNGEEEVERPNVNVPQDLMEKIAKRPTTGRSGSLSSKYAIWDEGDSFIIENYEGEDIHVIHNVTPQERNFFRRQSSSGTESTGLPGPSGDSPPISSQQEQRQSRMGRFFNRGSYTLPNSSPREQTN